MTGIGLYWYGCQIICNKNLKSWLKRLCMTFETNTSLLLCWQSRIEWGWNGSCYQTPATDTRRKNKNSSKLLGFNDCYHMWPICLILYVLFQFNIPVDQTRKLKLLKASHDQWNGIENTSNWRTQLSVSISWDKQTQTKANTKCFKDSMYARFVKSRGFKEIKYGSSYKNFLQKIPNFPLSAKMWPANTGSQTTF